MEKMNGGRPGTGKDDVFDAEVSGKLRLERLAFGSKDVVSSFDNLENAAVDGFGLMYTRQGNLRSQKGLLALSKPSKYGFEGRKQAGPGHRGGNFGIVLGCMAMDDFMKFGQENERTGAEAQRKKCRANQIPN